MVAFVVLDLVSSVLAKRLAKKSISDMTYFVLSGMLNLNSVIHSELNFVYPRIYALLV